MAAPAPAIPPRREDAPRTGLFPGSYRSNALRVFLDRMEREPDPSVLDVGPACEENIRFFAGRLRKVYVCDMFGRLDRCLREGVPFERAWNELDYPSGTFHGIVLWDLADRLDDREAQDLAKRCRGLLKPDGAVLLVATTEEAEHPAVHTFAALPDFHIRQRVQPQLSLPVRSRRSRDVLDMMSAFRLICSFICRPGLVEFLFRRR